MKKPKFELSRVFDKGVQEPPQVVPISEVIESAEINRRGFLKAGIMATAALAILKDWDVFGKENNSAAKQNCDVFAHNGSVTALAISSDGNLLISAGEDNIIKLWQLPDGALMKTIDNVPATTSLSINPDGKIFATRGLNNTIQLRSLPDGELIKTLDGHSNTVNALKFSIDGMFLVSGSSDHTVNIWNITGENQYKYQKIMWYKDAVHTVVVSPDGNTWASGCDDTTIVLGNFNGDITKTLKGINRAVVALDFSSDGKYLASVTNNNTMIIWDLESGTIVKRMNYNTRKTSYLRSLSFKSMVVLKSSDNEISLWRFPFFNLIKKIKTNVNVFSVTPNEKLLVVGTKEKTIQLWSLPDGNSINCLMDLKCTSSSVKGITYTTTNEWGQQITFTLPCGSPIPSGATCVCNCVPGSACTCNNHCTCNKVCTCNTQKRCSCLRVCSCVGHCTCNSICTCNLIYR